MFKEEGDEQTPPPTLSFPTATIEKDFTTTPLPYLNSIPDEFRKTIKRVHNSSFPPFPFCPDLLQSEVQEIVPAEFYWQANGLESYDLKDGMYVGLLKNNTNFFIKRGQLESAVGEVLTYRFFNDFNETQSIVPPVGLFQINSPFQLVTLSYQEGNTVTYHFIEAKGEYFIGTPFIKNSKLFIELLENPSSEETQQIFSLEEQFRLTSLLQACLGIRDNHLANYLWKDGNFFKIDGESAAENVSFEDVKHYAFKALPLPEAGEEILKTRGSGWERMVKENYTFSQQLIGYLESLTQPSTWQRLLDFSLWDGTKGTEHYNIEKAIARISAILKEIEVKNQ
ncbi:MAG: hypothetical protein K2W92_10335 [Alphaproteobacteria bacterium]|nr:hypothetical protein [Alphaproteobacteria bacterium]